MASSSVTPKTSAATRKVLLTGVGARGLGVSRYGPWVLSGHASVVGTFGSTEGPYVGPVVAADPCGSGVGAVRVVSWVVGTGLGCVPGPWSPEPGPAEGAGVMLALGVWAGALGVVTGATGGAVGSSLVSEEMAVVLGGVASVGVLEAEGLAGDRVLL